MVNQYNKMVNKISEHLKKFPDNKLLESQILQPVLNELSIYIKKGNDDKDNPNKVNYIKEIIDLIGTIQKNIYAMVIDITPQDIEKMTKRDIAAYMGALKKHLDCPQVKSVYQMYKLEFGKPERKDEFVGNPTSY